MANGERRARALGVFSLALGAAQLIAPARIARLTGLRTHRGRLQLVRALGARESLSGVVLLSGAAPAAGSWARALGDALDLAIVGAAWRGRSPHRRRLAWTAAAIGSVAVLDLMSARAARKTSASGGNEAGEVSRESVSVACSPEDAYGFWRNLENLPRVMPHLATVQSLGDGRSHWRAKGPAGKDIAWDAEIVADTPNQRIAWRSLPGGDVSNSGEVRFLAAPGGRGTEVHVELRYEPPGGALGTTVAKLLRRAPGQELDADLRVFKQLLETGEVARSDDSVRSGPNAARPQPHPVQA